MTTPAPKAPVERKTWAALVGGVLAAVVAVAVNIPSDVTATLPAPARALITLLAGLAPFVAAYAAPHTPRTDPAATAREHRRTG